MGKFHSIGCEIYLNRCAQWWLRCHRYIPSIILVSSLLLSNVPIFATPVLLSPWQLEITCILLYFSNRFCQWIWSKLVFTTWKFSQCVTSLDHWFPDYGFQSESRLLCLTLTVVGSIQPNILYQMTLLFHRFRHLHLQVCSEKIPQTRRSLAILAWLFGEV